MGEKARLHVFIEGRVQGVFFRAHTRDEAISRGLAGWVRNLPDGRVEALFEGEREPSRRLTVEPTVAISSPTSDG